MQLLQVTGCASDIFANISDINEILPGASSALIESLSDKSIFDRAAKELDFAEQNGIDVICYNSDRYPCRLRECSDAPAVLYSMGNADLNARHIVSVVGTRRITEYGKDLCNSFVTELASLLPDLLIVSGLAYGVDVCAHRAAIKTGIPTVGVMAHGLDRIYPASHRNIAKEMLHNGGLITEYMSETEPYKGNFLQRNRIVAGISDATVVIESPSYGGSLVTASLASGYMRDCFAFPGRVNDQFSIGCNEIIARNRAALITSAHDFVKAMNWDNRIKKKKNIEPELFPQLSPVESKILEFLKNSEGGMQINQMVIALDMPVSQVMPVLFELEMKGLIRTVAGGLYRIVM
ncbi:MAG: DNA-processing protein DprA [Bacteroidaceae bacterium]|nr:DNA-processing protein DprA [Bacteroidaceae bacterium]